MTTAIKVLNMGIVASPTSAPLSRAELDTLIDAGADITGVDVSEIQDLYTSMPFLNSLKRIC